MDGLFKSHYNVKIGGLPVDAGDFSVTIAAAVAGPILGLGGNQEKRR